MNEDLKKLNELVERFIQLHDRVLDDEWDFRYFEASSTSKVNGWVGTNILTLLHRKKGSTAFRPFCKIYLDNSWKMGKLGKCEEIEPLETEAIQKVANGLAIKSLIQDVVNHQKNIANFPLF